MWKLSLQNWVGVLVLGLLRSDSLGRLRMACASLHNCNPALHSFATTTLHNYFLVERLTQVGDRKLVYSALMAHMAPMVIPTMVAPLVLSETVIHIIDWFNTSCAGVRNTLYPGTSHTITISMVMALVFICRWLPPLGIAPSSVVGKGLILLVVVRIHLRHWVQIILVVSQTHSLDCCNDFHVLRHITTGSIQY